MLRERTYAMDVPVYQALFEFNEGFDEALRALDELGKYFVELSENTHDLRVRIEELRADASADFTVAISEKEREEEDRCWNLRREREEQREGHHEV
jgi:hypothetical protein